MDNKDKDDVALPEDKQDKPDPEKTEEETKADESVDGHPEPPVEDVKEEPDPEPESTETGPSLPEPPEEDAISPKTPILQERLKIFQSNDVATLEKKYETWTTEMRFLEDESDAYIAERHLEDGGNGMLYLAIFYVD